VLMEFSRVAARNHDRPFRGAGCENDHAA